MMKKKYLFVVLLLATLSLAGAAVVKIAGHRPGGERGGKDKLHIVTSFYPMYVAVQNVTDGIEGVTVQNLTKPKTGCLHDYQLTSQDMVTLSRADVFVINGGGMERFLAKAMKQYPSLPIITASKGIEFLKNDAAAEALHEEDGHAHEEEYNAHVWMDMSKYEQQIDQIVIGLSELDSAHADRYKENGRIYKQKLDRLKKQAESIVNRAGNRNIMIFHDSFAYFAREYGLVLKGTLEIDENTALSAADLAALVRKVRTEQVGILLAERQYGREAAEAVAKESGARVYVLDSLVTGDGTKDSYLKGMENNLDTLKEALFE